jgi:hypothetical protein
MCCQHYAGRKVAPQSWEWFKVHSGLAEHGIAVIADQSDDKNGNE